MAEKLREQGLTVKHATVNKYENDGSYPRVNYLLMFCDELDRNPYWILTGRGPVRWSEADQADYDAGRRDLANELRDWLEERAPEEEREGGDELAARELLENGGDGNDGE